MIHRRFCLNRCLNVLPLTLPRAYLYQSEEGTVNKATIEHVYKPDFEMDTYEEDEEDGNERGSPWSMGWQMHERNLVWTNDLRLRLIKRIASDESGIDEEQMESRLSLLMNLLPGLEQRLSSAPPKLVARLAADPQRIAFFLTKMKEIFPDADLSKMVDGRLSLLDDELSFDEISEATRMLRETLPSIRTDVFVSMFPQVLDKDDFLTAVEDFERIMPGRDLATQLRAEPGLILQLMKGKNLIPYDQVSNPFVSGQRQKID